MRAITSFIIKATLTLLAFWLVAHDVDGEQMKALLQTQNRTALAIAGALLMGQVMTGTVRWRMIVVALGEHIGMVRAFVLYYISVFFNCCLPGTIGGDVVRVFLAKKDVTLHVAISSVVIDRMIALLALGVLGVVTMPKLAGYVGLSAWLVTPPLVVLGLFGVWALCMLDRIIARISFVKTPEWLVHFAGSLRTLFARPKPAAWALFYALLGHIFYCLCAYILAGSMGVVLPFVDIVTLVPWVLLISIIPLSIGGWGLREAGMVWMLSLAGVPQAAALAISVQLGLLYIIISLPAAALWLAQRKAR